MAHNSSIITPIKNNNRLSNRSIYPDKTSKFITLDYNSNFEVLGLIIDFNTYKLSKNKINKTYRLTLFPEYYNGIYSVIATLEFISRKGSHYPLKFNVIKELKSPLTIFELDNLILEFKPILEKFEHKAFLPDIFLISDILPQSIKEPTNLFLK